MHPQTPRRTRPPAARRACSGSCLAPVLAARPATGCVSSRDPLACPAPAPAPRSSCASARPDGPPRQSLEAPDRRPVPACPAAPSVPWGRSPTRGAAPGQLLPPRTPVAGARRAAVMGGSTLDPQLQSIAPGGLALPEHVSGGHVSAEAVVCDDGGWRRQRGQLVDD